MAKKATAKTRKPTDATLRNVRAARARDSALTKRFNGLFADLEQRVADLEGEVAAIRDRPQFFIGQT